MSAKRRKTDAARKNSRLRDRTKDQEQGVDHEFLPHENSNEDIRDRNQCNLLGMVPPDRVRDEDAHVRNEHHREKTTVDRESLEPHVPYRSWLDLVGHRVVLIAVPWVSQLLVGETACLRGRLGYHRLRRTERKNRAAEGNGGDAAHGWTS